MISYKYYAGSDPQIRSSDQARSGQLRSYLLKYGQVKTGHQVRSTQVRSVRSGQVNSIRSYQGGSCHHSLQFRPAQVRSDQIECDQARPG